MLIGRLLYRLRSKYRHGLRTAYYRDVVRYRILDTAPVPATTDPVCEIHTLTSADDWLNLVWALKSFYRFSGRRYALCIHDDGTLSTDVQAHLRRHFPGARLVPRGDADRAVLSSLEPYPRCRELRKTNKLSLKVFDFRHYLESDRLMLLDSDVLFFAEPLELLRRIEDRGYRFNSVNADVASAYTVSPEAVREALGFELQPRFNSGLGLVQRESTRLDWIEEFLGLPGIVGQAWRIEQTLLALCSSKYGLDLLPAEYAVRLDGAANGAPCRHYLGAVRHVMYGEGIHKLREHGFLETRGAVSGVAA